MVQGTQAVPSAPQAPVTKARSDCNMKEGFVRFFIAVFCVFYLISLCIGLLLLKLRARSQDWQGYRLGICSLWLLIAKVWKKVGRVFL
jgi:hypothetical protein